MGAVKSKIKSVRRYILLAALVLSLRYSRGRFVFKDGKVFISFPHFLNVIGAASGGWLHVFLMSLFPRYHPVAAKRFYDTSASHEQSHLYSPEQLKPVKDDVVMTQTLSNGDHLTLANVTTLQKIQQEIIKCYDASEIVEENSYKEEQLVQLFDMLPEAKCEEMIARQFRGFVAKCEPYAALNYGFPPNTVKRFSWGKVYASKHYADPIVISWDEKYFMAVPMTGVATLNDENFRGSVTACMAYDSVAVKDFFKVLRPKGNGPLMLLGIFMMKEKFGGFFVLKEVEDSFFIQKPAAVKKD